jgi:hypothetical protein
LFDGMRRALVIAGVMLAGLLAAPPVAGAATTHRGVVFGLRANGFGVEGRGEEGSDRIRFVLDRHGELAEYVVPVRLGQGTVAVRLGRLGSIDLRFRPRRGEGPLGCGRTAGWQRGSFVGSIFFRGENDYADIDAGRAHGWFRTHPTGPCPKGGGGGRPPARRLPSRHPTVAETGAQIYGTTARQPPNRAFWFHTEPHRGSTRIVYQAFLVERREGMTIARGADVYGGAATFDWDLGKGTARVEPPAPFRGRAFYRSRPGRQPSLWQGSLSAPVLGGRPMRLTGAVFDTRLGLLS